MPSPGPGRNRNCGFDLPKARGFFCCWFLFVGFFFMFLVLGFFCGLGGRDSITGCASAPQCPSGFGGKCCCACPCVYRCAHIRTRVRASKGVRGRAGNSARVARGGSFSRRPLPTFICASSRFRVAAKLTESGAVRGGAGTGGALSSRSHWFGDNYF